MIKNTKRYYIAGNRLLTHVLFWAGYLLINTGVHINTGDPMSEYFLYQVFTLPGAALVAYGNLYVLYPRFFARKRYTAYGMLTLLLLFSGSLLNRIIQEWCFEPVFLPGTTGRDAIFVWYMLFKGMLWVLTPVLLFTLVIKVTEQGFLTEQTRQETEQEKLRAELDFLKAQVHPHFLFNTLNNLYALTLESSARAPEVVLKLSGLMSYMLYDSRAEQLSLNKEIQHIRNYIELEKLRYGPRLAVSLVVSGAADQCHIAPLLLIPFVENAFKHGAANETGEVWVTLDIKVREGWLQVKIENSCSDGTTTNPGEQGGIGLQNVRRRMDLLYAGNYELAHHQETGRYLVNLKIKTA